MEGEENQARKRNVASTDTDKDNPGPGPTTEDSQSSSTSANSSPSMSSAGTPPHQEILSPNSEYCKQLENWLWKCYMHRSLAVSAYFTALNQNYGHMQSTGSSTASTSNSQQAQPGQQRQPPGPGFRANLTAFAIQLNNQLNPQQRTALSQPHTLVKIPPIWKRIVAEIVDFLILMIVKLLVTFAIVDNFDVIDFENLESFQQQDGELRIASLYDLAFTISSELIILEIIHRLIACIVEGYCLSKSGCTPGKSLLNLRVVHAESLIPHPGNQPVNDVQYALVAPCSYLTFPRAFIRSAVKNFSLAFFFPLCFTLFHFEYSRTLYDMMGKSLVVENI